MDLSKSYVDDDEIYDDMSVLKNKVMGNSTWKIFFFFLLLGLL